MEFYSQDNLVEDIKMSRDASVLDESLYELFGVHNKKA